MSPKLNTGEDHNHAHFHQTSSSQTDTNNTLPLALHYKSMRKVSFEDRSFMNTDMNMDHINDTVVSSIRSTPTVINLARLQHTTATRQDKKTVTKRNGHALPRVRALSRSKCHRRLYASSSSKTMHEKNSFMALNHFDDEPTSVATTTTTSNPAAAMLSLTESPSKDWGHFVDVVPEHEDCHKPPSKFVYRQEQFAIPIPKGLYYRPRPYLRANKLPTNRLLIPQLPMSVQPSLPTTITTTAHVATNRPISTDMISAAMGRVSIEPQHYQNM